LSGSTWWLWSCPIPGVRRRRSPPGLVSTRNPGVGLGPQATIGKMDTYDKGFALEETGRTEVNDTNGLNRTRRTTRGTEACILTS